jgi:hypothetical protein
MAPQRHSRPFHKPRSARIEEKLINQVEDEVMKVVKLS